MLEIPKIYGNWQPTESRATHAAPSIRDGFLALPTATSRQRGSAKPGPSAKPAGVVAPARRNVMSAPAYLPKEDAPRRPGADDHYRYASRGF